MRSPPTTQSEQTHAIKLRAEARRFVDALAGRLGELEKLAGMAARFRLFSMQDYAEFRKLFLNFRDLCEEFHLLSRLTETSLAAIDQHGQSDSDEAQRLEASFRQLQMPMLRAMVQTNLRLLKVWTHRLQLGEGLPYGTRELFHETVRIINIARGELLRPRYLALLQEDALAEAAEADRLLRALIKRAPTLFDFVKTDAVDDELMRLIKGLPH